MEFYGIFHEMIDELLWMLVHGKKVPNATLPGPKGWENLPWFVKTTHTQTALWHLEGGYLEDHASGCKCLIAIRIRLRNPFQTMALKLMACNRWWVILTVLTSIRWTRPSSKWESKGTQPNATFTPRKSRPYLKGLLTNHWFPLTYWGLSPPFRFPSDQVFEKKLTCSEETGSFSARCISQNPFKRVVLRLFQHTFGTHP